MRNLPTLRQLKFLVAVADRRHFGQAAEACLRRQRAVDQILDVLQDLPRPIGDLEPDRGAVPAAARPLRAA